MVIEMPEMGESVTEGTVLEWHVEEGQHVAEGDTVVEVSTDKVDAEVPAPASGTIAKILLQPDDTVQVGQALAEMTAGASAATQAAGNRRRPPAMARRRRPALRATATRGEPRRLRVASPPPRASTSRPSRDRGQAAR